MIITTTTHDGGDDDVCIWLSAHIANPHESRGRKHRQLPVKIPDANLGRRRSAVHTANHRLDAYLWHTTVDLQNISAVPWTSLRS